MKLLAITDTERATEDEHLAAYGRLKMRLPDGALRVQLRDARRTAKQQAAFGRRLMSLGLDVVVNDRLDVAIAIGARGVHLGRSSVSNRDARALLGKSAWLSRAVHADDLATIDLEGVDAAIVSPIFASPGKGEGIGVAAIRSLRALHPGLEIVALGGIDAESARACFEAGASAVAVIRAALDEGAIERLAREVDPSR